MPTVEKVSVVIPVYNSERYLIPCIESVIKQTYKQLDILLIDDGSQDGSVRILDAYVKKDTRIRVIKRTNHGVSATRNLGIAEAMGEYILFVDADDEILQDSIRRLVQKQQKYQVDIVFGMHCYGYEKRVLKRVPRIAEGCYRYVDLKDSMIDDGTMTGILFGSVAGNLYRREFLEKNHIQFEETVRINEDGLFNLDCLRADAAIYQYCEKPTYLYRQWKSGKKKDYEGIRQSFVICDQELEKRNFPFVEDEVLQQQKEWRKITETFQVSLAICESMNYWKAKKLLKEIWNANEIANCKEKKSDRMNRYKSILYQFMTSKNYFGFYMIICYAYPLLKRLISR
ncbi:glycosyltransferase family 2 protein [Anaerosporobacter faecicola]|uniref:glycosyltransferase family 2 protein n=1 Tax=Anaerosporobacter faecicola TaxID=2718714 RepID=UPI001439BF06|nr:glycosyltransferase family 2 protein [Anaerosporobacter faecicola]